MIPRKRRAVQRVQAHVQAFSGVEESKWECVNAGLALIADTDPLPGEDLLQEEHAGGARRGFNGSKRDRFCERVKSKSAFPTCVIDFPFAAAGVLDLKGHPPPGRWRGSSAPYRVGMELPGLPQPPPAPPAPLRSLGGGWGVFIPPVPPPPLLHGTARWQHCGSLGLCLLARGSLSAVCTRNHSSRKPRLETSKLYPP